MQVAVRNRRVQKLGQCDGLFHAIGEHHAAARENDRKLRLGQRARSFVERRFVTRTATDADRLRNLDLDVAIEKVARNVELRRSHLQQRAIEAARRDLRDTLRVHHVTLILGDLREDRQLFSFLKTTQAHRHRAGFRRDHHDRRVRPIGSGDPGHEVGNSRTVLTDTDTMAARHPRVAVGHMHSALFVRHRNEADARSGKNVERVHIGRADYAEDIGHALCHHGFDERLRRRHSLHALGYGAVRLLHIGHRYPRLGVAAVLLYAGWMAGEIEV